MVQRRNQINNYQPQVINTQNPRRKKQQEWSALDCDASHPYGDKPQAADQQSQSIQHSYETITIRDSCDVDVTTTETQVAVNLQVAIQAAISLVISISVADGNKIESITQDLKANLRSSQINRQELYIENSRGVTVTTTDTDVAVNAQLLLQVLIVLLIRLDVL